MHNRCQAPVMHGRRPWTRKVDKTVRKGTLLVPDGFFGGERCPHPSRHVARDHQPLRAWTVRTPRTTVRLPPPPGWMHNRCQAPVMHGRRPWTRKVDKTVRKGTLLVPRWLFSGGERCPHPSRHVARDHQPLRARTVRTPRTTVRLPPPPGWMNNRCQAPVMHGHRPWTRKVDKTVRKGTLLVPEWLFFGGERCPHPSRHVTRDHQPSRARTVRTPRSSAAPKGF